MIQPNVTESVRGFSFEKKARLTFSFFNIYFFKAIHHDRNGWHLIISSQTG